MAFKQMDIDMLDAAQKSHLLGHLERDIQGIAKSLSLLANHNAPISMPTSMTSPPPSRIIESDLKISGDDEGKDEEQGTFQDNQQGAEEEDDFDALINDVPPPQHVADDDEIDLT